MYLHTGIDGLDKLAEAFSSKLPEGNITPAELQGFILDHMDKPEAAVYEVEAWAKGVVEEKEKEKEKKATKKKKQGTPTKGEAVFNIAQVDVSRPLPTPNEVSDIETQRNVTRDTGQQINGTKRKRAKKIFKKSKLGERVAVKKDKQSEVGWETEG
jgi:hypothetical protein